MLRSVLIVLLLLVHPLHAQESPAVEKPGLLVMAHGGDEDWNQAVLDAVQPLMADMPTTVAFGMANPHTLQEAVDRLESQGVTRIEVVRLFISGDSFLDATEYAFGIRSEKPPGRFMHEPHPLRLTVPVQLSSRGLMDVPGLGGILADRVTPLSHDPAAESVLIIGHGPGSDEENERWIANMDAMADSVRAEGPFAAVEVITLREDWTGKREVAEAAILAFVQAQQEAGRRVLVLPFRLRGFGPYAEVLEGFEYAHDPNGFLPDARISEWIRKEFEYLASLPAAPMTSAVERPDGAPATPHHDHGSH
jgi:sirohydrochlorin cobaltochelatase